MRKEVKRSEKEIARLTDQLHHATAKLIEQQQIANARYDELMVRVESGESRNAAVLLELAAASQAKLTQSATAEHTAAASPKSAAGACSSCPVLF